MLQKDPAVQADSATALHRSFAGLGFPGPGFAWGGAGPGLGLVPLVFGRLAWALGSPWRGLVDVIYIFFVMQAMPNVLLLGIHRFITFMRL